MNRYIPFVLLFLSLLFFPHFTFAAANHLVISEIASGVGNSSNEFVELYNPTDNPITINNANFKLKLVNSSNVVSNKSITWTNNIVPAHGFFLFVSGDIGVSADAIFSAQISSTSGVIIADNNDIVIDKVSWGTTTPPSSAVEGIGILHSLITGEGLERKAKSDSTFNSMTIGGTDIAKGNSEDTDNNSNDFIIRTTPDPQNSNSPIEILDNTIVPIIPENQKPVANAGVDQTVLKNTEISFNGSVSSDSDGSITSYFWDFKDGIISTEMNPKHIFSIAGTFDVELIVTDDDGATSSDICVINVNEPPVPIIYSTKVLLNEIFPAPGSSYDWDGDGVANSNDEWIELINLDDGQIDLSGWTIDDIEDGGSNPYIITTGTKIDPDEIKVFYKKEIGLVLNNSGDSVILKNPNGVMVDKYDFTSTSTDKSFARDKNSVDSNWVTNFPPSPGKLNTAPSNISPIANAGINITNAKVKENISFNGSASSDLDGVIIAYEWNFGDGTTASGSQAIHAYSTVGTYQATLTVRDNAGSISSSSINVAVVAGDISYQNDLSNDIKIAEILPDPVGSDTDNEYIKIYNLGVRDVNLRNWSLDDEDGGSKPYKIDYDLIIKAKSNLIFYNADTKLSLNNSGDHARLFDPENKIMDDIIYAGPVVEGAIYVLENGSWVWRGIPIASTNKDVPVIPKTNSEKTNTIANSNVIPPSNVITNSVPDIKKIAVTEPSIIKNQVPNIVPKKDISFAQNMEELFIDPGNSFSPNTLASSSSTIISQSDLAVQDFPPLQNSPAESNSKRIVLLFAMAVFGLVAIKSLIRAEDWKWILEKFKNKKKIETINSFEELFK